MRATQENYSSKGQLAHVEREQVDIRADIKIIQHDIVSIKENMATKANIVSLESQISSVRSELKTEILELRLELKTDLSELKSSILKWNISLFIAGLTINLTAIGAIAALVIK